MIINKLVFPDKLIDAIKEDKLVVFVGAGVSQSDPTNLPNFVELVEIICKGTNHRYDKNKGSLDVFLGIMQHEGIGVKERAAAYFSERDAVSNNLHLNIVNLFKDRDSIKIVTTNYDKALEKALIEDFGQENKVKIYSAPALPIGNEFNGIVHLHGNHDEPKNMVMTDSDFGVAYLFDSFATRFLVKLFSEYTVLFIGYSYDDVVMNYLSRSLPTNKISTRYIMTDNTEKKWGVLGIDPIFFPKGNLECQHFWMGYT